MAYEGRPASEFVDVEFVQSHLDKSTAFIAKKYPEVYRYETDALLRYDNRLRFDSPLEAIFFVWWEALLRTANPALRSELWLEPQAEVTVGGQVFRVDFLIEPRPRDIAQSKHWHPIAIELDGHAFHERTPEQVAYRDRRDRALQASGWQIFHFSFREFTKNPHDSVVELMVFARGRRANALTEIAREQSIQSGGSEP